MGKAVSRNEAALAVSVAAEFMNYIGFTVELELRLLEFKDSMETGNYTGETKKDIEEYFMEYFKPAKFTTYVVKDEFGGEFKYTKIDFSHHSLLLRIKDARRGSTHLLESIPVGIMAEALSDAKAIRGIWLRIVERSDPIRLQMLKSQYEELILFCEIIQPK